MSIEVEIDQQEDFTHIVVEAFPNKPIRVTAGCQTIELTNKEAREICIALTAAIQTSP